MLTNRYWDDPDGIHLIYPGLLSMRLTSNIIGCEGSRTVRVILFNVCCPIRFIIHGTFTSHSIEVS